MVLEANDQEVTQEVIDACQQGDPDAFSALFEAHKDRVYSIALRFSGDPAAALDIAQETFLKLFSRIRDFRAEASFDSWLYRIVVNTCLDHHRKGRRLAPFLENLADVFRAPDASALERMLHAEMQDHVQRVIGKLPPDLRIVVVLRYTESLAYEEIADILGCPPGTVASRLNRAHKLLERRLAKFKNGRGGDRA